MLSLKTPTSSNMHQLFIEYLLYYKPTIILDARGRGVNKIETIQFSCSLCSYGGDEQKPGTHKYFQIITITIVSHIQPHLIATLIGKHPY